MEHIFQQGKDKVSPIFLMLHGTGGTERDLIPLATKLNPDASVLSVRGNVLENGMPRFFKRISEGVFDEEDLIFRTKELNDFLNEAAEKYNFDRSNILAMGYSNGANIAASLLFHYQDALKGAILHHPMVPRRGIELPNLSGKLIFIGAGKNDPQCPPEESEELKTLFEQANAEVLLHWENSGHLLTGEEFAAAREWYEQTF